MGAALSDGSIHVTQPQAMEFNLSTKNPVLLIVIAVVVLGGGGWYAWKHPDKLWEFVRGYHDSDTFVDVPAMRAALDDDLVVFLRHELVKEMHAASDPNSDWSSVNDTIHIDTLSASPRDYFRTRQDFVLAREDRWINFRLTYTVGDRTGEAVGEAQLSRHNRWTLYSVALVK